MNFCLNYDLCDWMKTMIFYLAIFIFSADIWGLKKRRLRKIKNQIQSACILISLYLREKNHSPSKNHFNHSSDIHNRSISKISIFSSNLSPWLFWFCIFLTIPIPLNTWPKAAKPNSIIRMPNILHLINSFLSMLAVCLPWKTPFKR